jgi:hypothetical protein
MCNKLTLFVISFAVTLAIILSSFIGFAAYQVYPSKLINGINNVYNFGGDVIIRSAELIISNGETASEFVKNKTQWISDKGSYWTNATGTGSWISEKGYLAWINIKNTGSWISEKGSLNIFNNQTWFNLTDTGSWISEKGSLTWINIKDTGSWIKKKVQTSDKD